MPLPIDPNAITIVAHGCSVTLNDPMLALAWMRAVVQDIPPDWFVKLVQALNPLDGDKMVQAQHLVDMCFGVGT